MMLQQQSLKKVMVLFVLALLLGVDFSFLGGSSNVHAAEATPHACEGLVEVRVPGGYASWTKCYFNGYIEVKGSVEDTRPDGKCAKVYAYFDDGGYQEKNACGWGNSSQFVFNELGAHSVQVYLSTYDD